MVSTSRDESGLRPPTLCDFETEYAAVEGERSFDVSHFQVNVSDMDGRINGADGGFWHVFFLSLMHVAY